MKNNYHARIIVAGGETSGAVTKSLNFSSYSIADSIAPNETNDYILANHGPLVGGKDILNTFITWKK